MKSSKRACCCRKLAAAGWVVSFLRVRCMRSWRPFCWGLPGLIRSMAIPSLSHQTESLDRLKSALGLAKAAHRWSPTLFRKAFHIEGNDDLRWVSLTYGLQVF